MSRRHFEPLRGHEHGHLDPRTEDISQKLVVGSSKELGFGEKDIGFFGGMSLLVNNMTGPAMVAIPLIFQKAGWVPTLGLMLVLVVISNLSSTLLCEAMSYIPNNERFQARIEMSTVANAYLPSYFYTLTMVLLIIALEAANITAIIVSAQTMDMTLLAIFKWTAGIEFHPSLGFVTSVSAGTGITPFPGLYLISLGFFIVLLLAIPLGFYNLDDNIIVQEGALALMIAIALEWFVSFCVGGLDFRRVPAWGTDQTVLIGTLIFNYAFVVSVPSWVNEKKPSVSINKSIWISSFVSTGLFIVVGLFGAAAFTFTGNEDLLDVINTDSHGRISILSRITVFLFPAVACLSGIPVNGIIIRYNLVRSGLCNKYWANFWGVVFPWLISVPFYTGSGFMKIITWTSLCSLGAINFVIPLALYVLAERAARRAAHHGTTDGAGASGSAINVTPSDHSTPQMHEQSPLLQSAPANHAVLIVHHNSSSGHYSSQYSSHHSSANSKCFYAIPQWRNHSNRTITLAIVLMTVTAAISIGGIVINVTNVIISRTHRLH